MQVNAQSKRPVADSTSRTIAWEYAVAFNSSVRTYLSFFNSAIADTQLSAKVEGSLNIQVRTDKDNRTHSCCRFTSIGRLQLPLPAYVTKQVNNCLKSGFCFGQDVSGVVDSIYFPIIPGEAAEHIVVQLIEGFQHYEIQDTQGASFDQILSLSDGKVLAGFHQSAGKNGQRILIMDSLRSVRGAQMRQIELLPQHTTYNTSVRFGLDPLSAIPVTVDGCITRESRISHRVASRMTNTYSFLRVRKIAGEFIDRGHQYGRPLFYPERVSISQRKQLMERAAKVKSSQLEEALIAVTDSTAELQQLHIGDDLNAVLAVRDSSISLIGELFIHSDPRSARFKLIRGSLISSATPEAQKIISNLISQYRSYDPSLLRYIIPSAGLIKRPGYELQYQMESLIADSVLPPERRGAVYLALGNMAGQLNEEDELRADSLVKTLVGSLERANDPMLLLAVLGNAGTKSSLPVILPYLEDSSAAISAAAYYALRFIADTSVDGLYMSQLMKTDFKGNNQAAVILESLFYRSYHPALASLMEQIIKNGTAELQLLYLQLICHHSYHEAQLLDLIRIIGIQHKDNETGKAANAFLERAGL